MKEIASQQPVKAGCPDFGKWIGRSLRGRSTKTRAISVDSSNRLLASAFQRNLTFDKDVGMLHHADTELPAHGGPFSFHFNGDKRHIRRLYEEVARWHVEQQARSGFEPRLGRLYIDGNLTDVHVACRGFLVLS